MDVFIALPHQYIELTEVYSASAFIALIQMILHLDLSLLL